MRHFGSALGYNIACLATPKLMSTTNKSTTKYIMFLTIFPIMVTRGPMKYKLLSITLYKIITITLHKIITYYMCKIINKYVNNIFKNTSC